MAQLRGMKALMAIVSATCVLLGTVTSPIGAVDDPFSDAATPPHVVHRSDERSREQIAAAGTAFRVAGLKLPSLEIYVHETYAGCGGFAGQFNRDGSGLRVDFCSGNSFTVLHEFAHAWEYHNVDDTTRNALVETHGLETWRSSEVPWAERGVEVAAETIAKGLLERAFPEWQCEEVELLDEGFRLLTGRSSPRFVAGRLSCDGLATGDSGMELAWLDPRTGSSPSDGFAAPAER
jgi:hypothetical protein